MYFLSGYRVGQFANIYVLIDILFTGCQGRPNHSSIMNAVSCFACSCQWPHMHRACSASDPTCIVHAVSMSPHASCMRFHWPHIHRACGFIDPTFTVHVVSIENFDLLRQFEFMCKRLEPLSHGPRMDILMKKPRIKNLLTLSL
jgi:hypothetical protein